VIPRAPLWLIPALFLAHNAEEALTIDRYLPLVRARAPAALQPVVAGVTYPAFLWAVGLATLLPLAVVAWAAARPGDRAAHWLAATTQAVVALNVASHVAAAAALRGYSPGLATALLLNLPFSLYFFRRAARERWLPRRALWGTIPAAVAVHGPGLVGLLALARFLAGAGRP
jgi:hypothetical protein